MGLVASLWTLFSGKGHARAVSGSIYDFKAKDLQGREVDFNQFKGKHLLIVNTASKCGFTPQFTDLEQLHSKHGQHVTVLGFPSNNFLWQEPGTAEEIESFCQKNYGVTFPMLEKISVKGKDAHPIYQWLHAKTGRIPTWNFCKYLIDKNGIMVKFYPSKISPLDDDIVQQISK
jgi:glutathione peroxidase